MSCRWHIRCVDCNETHEFVDATRMLDVMFSLCDHAAAIAALAPLLAEQPDELWIQVGYQNGSAKAAWFLQHLGHRLCPIDEYGDLATDEDRKPQRDAATLAAMEARRVTKEIKQ